MRSKRATKRNRVPADAVLRLWLALLLAVLPLLSAAQSLPMTSVDPADRTVSEVRCHTAAKVDGSAADHQDVACPHCSGDAAASLCHCGGHAPPTGLSYRGWPPVERTAALARLPLTVPAPLPQSPNGRLFRPPISGS